MHRGSRIEALVHCNMARRPSHRNVFPASGARGACWDDDPFICEQGAASFPALPDSEACSLAGISCVHSRIIILG